jgi:predicted nucleic acid-binding protein
MASGLLDTSVVVDLDDEAVRAALPDDVAVSAITLAELAIGPILAASSAEGARRQVRLQQIEATFETLPFDVGAARSYAQVVGAAVSSGRSHRRRVANLLIAATAHANGMALYTRNPGDLAGLESLIEIVDV